MRGATPAALALAALAACACAALLAAPSVGAAPQPPTPRLAVQVVRVHPHDPAAFTQGLLFHDGKLYESTGQLGASRLREVELATGRVLREVALPAEHFGEGLALWRDRLVQLTWLNGVAHVWRLSDFEPAGRFVVPGEAWGLAFDGSRFVMSDGTATLRFRDAETFEVTGRVTVRRDGAPVAYLNELEAVGATLYANVWISDELVAIDPRDGRVRATYDASGLLSPDEAARADVLNGIAHDPRTGRFFLTGKYWPKLFEVELPAPPGS